MEDTYIERLEYKRDHARANFVEQIKNHALIDEELLRNERKVAIVKGKFELTKERLLKECQNDNPQHAFSRAQLLSGKLQRQQQELKDGVLKLNSLNSRAQLQIAQLIKEKKKIDYINEKLKYASVKKQSGAQRRQMEESVEAAILRDVSKKGSMTKGASREDSVADAGKEFIFEGPTADAGVAAFGASASFDVLSDGAAPHNQLPFSSTHENVDDQPANLRLPQDSNANQEFYEQIEAFKAWQSPHMINLEMRYVNVHGNAFDISISRNELSEIKIEINAHQFRDRSMLWAARGEIERILRERGIGEVKVSVRD